MNFENKKRGDCAGNLPSISGRIKPKNWDYSIEIGTNGRPKIINQLYEMHYSEALYYAWQFWKAALNFSHNFKYITKTREI